MTLPAGAQPVRRNRFIGSTQEQKTEEKKENPSITASTQGSNPEHIDEKPSENPSNIPRPTR